MSSLYEINMKYEEILTRLFTEVDEETGEVNPEILAELEQMQEERTEKLEAIGCFIKNLNAEAQAIKAEMDALKKRYDQKMNKADKLVQYVCKDLIAHDEKKFDAPRVSYSFRSSEVVNILDETKIPKKYLNEKITISPDKTAIKKAIKDGQTVEGCEIVKKQNLQIK